MRTGPQNLNRAILRALMSAESADIIANRLEELEADLHIANQAILLSNEDTEEARNMLEATRSAFESIKAQVCVLLNDGTTTNEVAIVCVVESLLNERSRLRADRDALRAENERLREFVDGCARQESGCEMDDETHERADFEGAFDFIVKEARAAIAGKNTHV